MCLHSQLVADYTGLVVVLIMHRRGVLHCAALHAAKGLHTACAMQASGEADMHCNACKVTESCVCLQAWSALHCARVCWPDQHAAGQPGARAATHTERGKLPLP